MMIIYDIYIYIYVDVEAIAMIIYLMYIKMIKFQFR